MIVAKVVFSSSAALAEMDTVVACDEDEDSHETAAASAHDAAAGNVIELQYFVFFFSRFDGFN